MKAHLLNSEGLYVGTHNVESFGRPPEFIQIAVLPKIKPQTNYNDPIEELYIVKIEYRLVGTVPNKNTAIYCEE